MPFVILKKTFKVSGIMAAHEMAFSLHGSIDAKTVDRINQRVGAIALSPCCHKLLFKMNSVGHYYAAMNHNFQKHHEEDAVCAILDTMEQLGFTFQFEYDTTSSSVKLSGSSSTQRELFLFHRSA